MADDKEIVVGSLITLACSLGAASLLLKKKRKHSTWVKKYIRDREQYGECNTSDTELLLQKWWNVSTGHCPVYANGYQKYRWSGRVLSFPNSTTRTHRLCLRPDQTHGQNPYMSRLNRQVYDQTKSADLSDTQAGPTGLRRRTGSATKSGRARLVEFGHYSAHAGNLFQCTLCTFDGDAWSTPYSSTCTTYVFLYLYL